MEFVILLGLMLGGFVLVEWALWAGRHGSRNSVRYLILATLLRGLAYTPGIIAAGHGAIPVPNGLGLLFALSIGSGDGAGYYPMPWVSVPLTLVFFLSVFVRQRIELGEGGDDGR